MKRKLYIASLIALVLGIVSFSFRAKQDYCATASATYPGGASLKSGSGYSGASWDNSGGTCANCHSGGSYGPSTTLTLMSGSNIITSYSPGSAYTLKLTITSTSGSPKYGFTVMCAQSTVHTNVNGWGTMPGGLKNNVVKSRNYVEQSAALAATTTGPSSYTVSIPWTAPAAGTGSVTFYGVGMAVNGNGGTSGDSPSGSVNLTVSELSTTPVTMSAFTVETDASGNVLVKWVTQQELNTSHFVIERSMDGSNWLPAGDIRASGNSFQTVNYSYTDNTAITGNIYYRIKTIDKNGAINYSATRTILNTANHVHISCKSVVPLASGSSARYDILSDAIRQMNISITDISGKIVYKTTAKISSGINTVWMPVPVMRGIYVIRFESENFKQTFNQVVQ